MDNRKRLKELQYSYVLYAICRIYSHNTKQARSLKDLTSCQDVKITYATVKRLYEEHVLVKRLSGYKLDMSRTKIAAKADRIRAQWS